MSFFTSCSSVLMFCTSGGEIADAGGSAAEVGVDGETLVASVGGELPDAESDLWTRRQSPPPSERTAEYEISELMIYVKDQINVQCLYSNAHR